MHTLHSGNLYQIFTYVKNKDTEFGDEPHRVSGMLLYAATDEAIQPDTVSFQDVTTYTSKEKSFFGARDANRMNEAMNKLAGEYGHHFSESDTGY